MSEPIAWIRLLRHFCAHRPVSREGLQPTHVSFGQGSAAAVSMCPKARMGRPVSFHLKWVRRSEIPRRKRANRS
jgi:hypothetical protein